VRLPYEATPHRFINIRDTSKLK